MKAYALTPQDAWFFRDGRPYNLGESNQSDVVSLFPPPTRTITGAIRAALARQNRWNGKPGQWPPDVTATLGDGPNNLGKLQFTGPFIIYQADKDSPGQALWPLPRHVLGLAEEAPEETDDKKHRWVPKAFLCPGSKRYFTDVSEEPIYLPEISGKKEDSLKPNESAWIAVEGINRILDGELPQQESVYLPSKLWKLEARVGLQRNSDGKNDLYSPSFVRLTKETALGIAFSGAENLKGGLPLLFPLGGESRLAQCESWTGDLLPAVPPRESFIPDETGRIRFAVILLTPGGFREPPLPGATIISACQGKPVLIGGWDSLKREPLPLRPFTPPGSVWFCTADQADFASIHAHHGKHIDSHTAHGFGQIVIGHWPQPTR